MVGHSLDTDYLCQALGDAIGEMELLQNAAQRSLKAMKHLQALLSDGKEAEAIKYYKDNLELLETAQSDLSDHQDDVESYMEEVHDDFKNNI